MGQSIEEYSYPVVRLADYDQNDAQYLPEPRRLANLFQFTYRIGIGIDECYLSNWKSNQFSICVSLLLLSTRDNSLTLQSFLRRSMGTQASHIPGLRADDSRWAVGSLLQWVRHVRCRSTFAGHWKQSRPNGLPDSVDRDRPSSTSWKGHNYLQLPVEFGRIGCSLVSMGNDANTFRLVLAHLDPFADLPSSYTDCFHLLWVSLYHQHALTGISF